jgi:uncharacterized protein YqeY
MSLEIKINEDIKTAMLAREKDKLEALRAVKSAVLMAKTEKTGGAIDEDTEIKMLQKMVKQRKEAAEIYLSQSRQDMADAELFQASVIEAYLPTQLSAAEIEVALKEIIAETGATSAKEMGKVMGLASQRLSGKADGKLIAQLVKEMLS